MEKLTYREERDEESLFHIYSSLSRLQAGRW